MNLTERQTRPQTSNSCMHACMHFRSLFRTCIRTTARREEDLAVLDRDEDQHAVLLGGVTNAPRVVHSASEIFGCLRKVAIAVLFVCVCVAL